MTGSYWDPSPHRDAQIEVALGERPADLVIRGGRLVDVHTGEIYPADVAVAGSRIAAVGDVGRCIGDGTRAVDATGRFIVPGFIETHFHIGASALTMTELARLLVPFGTAAVVTDFNEPAAMRGTQAMRFFLDEAAPTPLKVYLSPFCPSFGEGGTRNSIAPAEFEATLDWPETVEVREWYLSREYGGSDGERAIGARARATGLILSGHMAGMHGPMLQACVAAGIRSDHEATTAEQALARARLGVAVQIRFSSGIRDLEEILRAIVEHGCDSRPFMFSTDEEDVDDIAALGHIDHRVRTAIAAGIAPVDAIRMGSLNAAEFLGVTGDLGSVTPGRLAFVNVVDDLARVRVSTVVAGSRVVAQGGRYVAELPSDVTYPPAFYDSVNLGRAPDFAVAAPDGASTATVRAIATRRDRPAWKEEHVELPVRDGRVLVDAEQDVAKVAVLERHHGTGRMGVGFVKGWGVERGAFGSAFHPVNMNVGIVGADDADMALVANRIAELGGGFVAALDGDVIAEVALPILGYLSAEPAGEVVAGFRAVRAAVADRLGCAVPGLYTALGYLLIPVAPGLHVLAAGLERLEYTADGEVRTPLPVLV